MKHFDDYNWTEVRTAVTQARSAMSALSPVAKMISKALAADPEAEAACQTYRVARATCIAAEESLRELTGDIDLQDDSWAEGTIRACNALSAHGDKLQEWMRWRKLARKLEARKLACVVDALMIDADPALIVNGFKSSLYRTMCAFISFQTPRGRVVFRCGLRGADPPIRSPTRNCSNSPSRSYNFTWQQRFPTSHW